MRAAPCLGSAARGEAHLFEAVQPEARMPGLAHEREQCQGHHDVTRSNVGHERRDEAAYQRRSPFSV